jgi:hypothetical protein
VATTLYSFRERFHLGDRVRIQEDGHELVLTKPEDAPHIVFISDLGSSSISESADLALKGEGFGSHEDATAAATKWSAYLQFGLARRYVGAEFNLADPLTGRVLGEHKGKPILRDGPGRIIYETEPAPVFSLFRATTVVNKNPSGIITAVQAAREMDLSQTLDYRIAFDLFGMSFSSASYATRLVILMMAAETLIKQKLHPREVAQLIDEFLAQAHTSDIPVDVKESLAGSLRQLKKQSVGQAGRELASEALSGRTYQGLDPHASLVSATPCEASSHTAIRAGST